MVEDPNVGSITVSIQDVTNLKQQRFSVAVGNNHWNLRVYTRACINGNDKYLGINLQCNKDVHSDSWSCNASVRLTLKKFDSENNDDGFTIDDKRTFTRNNNKISLPCFKKWEDMTNPSNHFVKDNSAIVQCSIFVNSSQGFRKVILERFDEPKKNLTDVVLLVEGKKVHVSKHMLAMHSRYFEALFFSDFKESTETEIPIEDVDYSIFIDFLNLIYPSNREIQWDEIYIFLKLADRFDMWTVTDKIESFLINYHDNLGEDDSELIVEKLSIAEDYKLVALQKTCCDKLKSAQDVFNLSKEERYDQLGSDTHGMLFRRLIEIQKDCADNDS